MRYYCDKCKKQVLTKVIDLTDTWQVKDLEVLETIKIRVCKDCGFEIYDPKIEVRNEKVVFGKYNELCTDDSKKIRNRKTGQLIK